MDDPLILVLDEGTTSTRAMLFTPSGELRGTAQRELTQHYPRPGWVEHDAGEIWDKTLACAREMVDQPPPARDHPLGAASVDPADRQNGDFHRFSPAIFSVR